MNCINTSGFFERFLFWLNWGKMPESEESILRDLEKIGMNGECVPPYRSFSKTGVKYFGKVLFWFAD